MSQLNTDLTVTQPFSFVTTDKDGNIHVAGTVQGDGGVLMPNAGSTPQALNFYVQPTAATSLTLGTALTGTANAYFTRIGNFVVVKIAAFSGTASASLGITLSQIPSIFRPNVTNTKSLFMPTYVLNNGTYVPGTATISSADVSVITLKDNTGVNFTGTSGFSDIVLSWVVNV